jgi:hypothetical protein
MRDVVVLSPLRLTDVVGDSATGVVADTRDDVVVSSAASPSHALTTTASSANRTP